MVAINFHFSLNFELFTWHSYFTLSVIANMEQQTEAQKPARVRIVCQFCNAIVACDKGSSAMFSQHMEDQHNIFQEQDLVLAIHFLGEKLKTDILKKTKIGIQEVLGIRNHGALEEDEEEEEEEEIRIFDYPRLEAAPQSKNWNLDLLRKQVSNYLTVQGFGRNMKRLGHGEPPIGWPEQKYKWKTFKGTGRGCPKQMLEDIIFALLAKQNINPADFVEELGENCEEASEPPIMEATEVEVDIMVDTYEDRDLQKKQSELEARLKEAVNELQNDDSEEVLEEREVKKSKSKRKHKEDQVARKSARVKKPTRHFFDFIK